ncbi:MAG: phosphotransferase [Candidatus Moraniibacteriota bacterium]
MDSSKNISIEGKSYSFVKTRAYQPVSVYQCENEFLRIGPKNILSKEIALSRKLLEFDFPIPQILSEGEKDDQYYFTETSLGDTLFGDIFWKDARENGFVSDENFQKLLVLIEKFTRAQLKTAEPGDTFESFYFGIHMEHIIEELPYLEEKLIAGFEKLKKRTSSLPVVMTHGDFNPYNFFEAGVIDFESMFEAPVGYDIICALYHTFLFPNGTDFESTRRYEFSEDQIDKYFALVDKIYVENNLPKVSDFSADFIFSRMIWSAVRMQRMPKVQKWRYEKLEKILDSYLSNGDVVNILIK